MTYSISTLGAFSRLMVGGWMVTSSLLVLIGCGNSHAMANQRIIDEHFATLSTYEVFSGTLAIGSCDGVVISAAHGIANRAWDIELTSNSRMKIASITKNFTATLIMMLVEDAELDLDTPITDYLSEYPPETGERITIRHLLSHTSGIPNIFENPSMVRQIPAVYSPGELVAQFSQLPLDFEPGQSFRYSNSNYDVLGAIIEHVTGDSFANILKARITEPLNLQDTGYYDGDTIIEQISEGYERTLGAFTNAEVLPEQAVYAAGMMYSTPMDIHTFNCALREGELISNTVLRDSMWTESFPGSGYGYGFHVAPVNVAGKTYQSVGHPGSLPGVATRNLFLIDQGLSAVVLGNVGDLNAYILAEDLISFHYDEPVDAPKRSLYWETLKVLKSDGIMAAKAFARKVLQSKSSEFSTSEDDLNLVGYRLLQNDRRSEAVEVLSLNAEMFPSSANVYDSLGEAYFAAGNLDASRENFRRSIELNADNENARSMLQRLETEGPGE